MSIKTSIHRSLNLVLIPIFISFFITPIRFCLELIGIPEEAIFIIGLLWLTLAVAIYWGIKLHHEQHSFLLLFLSLIIFSPISRIPVAIFWWIDKKWELGTHYGLYFDTFWQVLLNHIVYGSIIQIIPGFIVGAITLTIMGRRKTFITKRNSVENE